MTRPSAAQLQRLIELHDAHGSILTPEAVVQDATPPESVLHAIFPWNDAEAGHQRRVDIARQLLRVRFPVATETTYRQVPYFIHNPNLPQGQQGYTRVATLKQDPDSARESVRAEVARVEASLLRAKALAEVLGHADLIQDLLDRLSTLKLVIATGSSGGTSATI